MDVTVFAILAVYLTKTSIDDIKYREINNCAPVLIIMASPFISQIDMTDRLIGMFGLFLPLLALNYLLGVGMGDVKLAAAFGFLIGAIPEYCAFLVALITALLINKIKKYEDGIPLAPYICAANLVMYFVGGFYLC